MLRRLGGLILTLPFECLVIDEVIQILITSRKVALGQGHQQNKALARKSYRQKLVTA